MLFLILHLLLFLADRIAKLEKRRTKGLGSILLESTTRGVQFEQLIVSPFEIDLLIPYLLLFLTVFYANVNIFKYLLDFAAPEPLL
jgi:hypothetical protein